MSKVMGGAIKLGLSGAGQAVLQIVVTAYLARLLSPRDFGIVAAALIITDLMIGFSQVGMGPSLVQKRDIEDRHIRTAFTLCIILGIFGTVSVALSAKIIAHFLHSPDSVLAIQILSFAFILNNAGIVADSLAARRLQFGLLAKRRLVGFIVGYPIIGIISAATGAGALSLVFANLGQIATTTAIMLVSSPHPKRPLIDMDAFKSMWAFGLGFSVARLLNTFAAKIDQFVVARSFNLVTLGLYTRAHAIMRFPINTLGQIVEDVAFPSMSSIQDDRSRISNSYLQALSLANCVMFPAAFFVAIMANEIVDVLLGDKWRQAAPILMVLAFTLPLRSTQRLGSAVLRALGHSWLVAGSQLVYLGAVMLGAYFGARYGVVGSATGVSIAVLIQFFILALFLVNTAKIDAWQITLSHLWAVPMIALTSMTAYVSHYAFHKFGMTSLVEVVLVSGTTGIAFLAAVLWGTSRFFGARSFQAITLLRTRLFKLNFFRQG